MAITSTQVTELEDAIHALATGRVASYTVNGRTVTYYDLPALRELLADWRRQVASAAGANRRNKALFRRAD